MKRAEKKINIHASALGKIKTPKKARASRRNGKMGGRPGQKKIFHAGQEN